jgi:hypothetical protein
MVLALDGERVASITGFAGGTRHLTLAFATTMTTTPPRCER